jgi:cation transport regulator
MPYKTNAKLPESVRNVLPDHAQDIYREAFNSAWDHYDTHEERHEVKKSYEKNESTGKWRQKKTQAKKVR